MSDSRIRYIKQDNLGQPKTRNKAVRMSKGRLIALLDADDIWKPTKLQKQVEIFDKYPNVGVCSTALELIRPSGESFGISGRNEFHGLALPALVSGDLSVAMSSSITRISVFDKIGFFDEGFLPFSMDYDFWLRAAMEFDFYNISEPLTLYRTGHASISSEGGDNRRNLVMNVVIPRFVKEYGGSKYVKWHHVWANRSDCYFGRATGKEKWHERVYWLLRSLLCNPLKRDSWGFLARQFLPGRLVDAVKKWI